MKKADKIMSKILGLVKDEHKAMVEASVKKATEEFLALSEEEQEEYFLDIGTIGYFFDDNKLEFDREVHELLISNEDEEECDFVDFVCDYLDCFLD